MNPIAPLLLVLLQGLLPQVGQDPGTSYRFRVRESDPRLLTILRQEFDVPGSTRPDGSMDVIVLPEELPRFRALALASVELVDRGRPLRDIVAEQRRQAGPLAPPDPNYYTVAEVEAKLAELETNYPAIARKVNLTALVGGPKTHYGHDLYAVKISDNPAVREDEPVVLLAAQHHAREVNTTHMVIGAAQRILAGYATDPAIRSLVDEHELYLVPIVNPDGVDHVWNVDNNWRKNRRDNGSNVFGVDNNRNYRFMWSSACGGSTLASSSTYRGPSAGSEPENQVMIRFGEMFRPEKYLDFHSSGRQVLNTYNSCATKSATTSSLIVHYRNALGTPMGYTYRDPSAAGEAPEHHWTESGSLSYLVEISTAFQPPWSSTVAEEAQVWPGTRAFLDFDPAMAGHVRSLCNGRPLEARIEVLGMGFAHAEQNPSERTFGRYKVWAPPGSYAITFKASGFKDQTRNLTVTAYDATFVQDVYMEPVWADATLAKSGSERIGTPVQLTYTSPGDSGLVYWIPMALGSSPGVGVGGNRIAPINGDPLFAASVSLAPVLVNNLGVLPGSGTVAATFNIPSAPFLVNFTLYFCGFTFEPCYPSEVKKFSQSVSITIKP